MLYPAKRLIFNIIVIHHHPKFCFQPEFYQVCHTKAQYDEYGPSICRHNPVFGTMTWAHSYFFTTSTLHFWFLTWSVLPDAISCNQESRIIRWQGSWSDNGTACVTPWGLKQIFETWDVCVIFDIAKWRFARVMLLVHLVKQFARRHDLTPSVSKLAADCNFVTDIILTLFHFQNILKIFCSWKGNVGYYSDTFVMLPFCERKRFLSSRK